MKTNISKNIVKPQEKTDRFLSLLTINFWKHEHVSETNSEPYQTFQMESFGKIIKS